MKMFLLEQAYKETSLSKRMRNHLGEAIPLKRQKKEGGSGSNLFWIREYQINGERKEDINLRCHFGKFENGLLLSVDESQKTTHIAVDYASIDSIKLEKGEETIAPLWISPFRLLLYLKVPVRYARYFRWRLSEYSIGPLRLKIFSGEDFIFLDSNGYNYESTRNYFKSLRGLKPDKNED
jgi:hypothetical protein